MFQFSVPGAPAVVSTAYHVLLLKSTFLLLFSDGWHRCHVQSPAGRDWSSLSGELCWFLFNTLDNISYSALVHILCKLETQQCDIKHLWSHSFSKHDQMSWALAEYSHQCFWSRKRLQEMNQANHSLFTSLIWTLSDYTWQPLFWNIKNKTEKCKATMWCEVIASGSDRGHIN